ANPEERHAGIELSQCMAHRARDGSRRKGGMQNEVHSRITVESRVTFRSRLARRVPSLLYIANYADDLLPRTDISARRIQFSQRILVGPEVPRHCLIDHCWIDHTVGLFGRRFLALGEELLCAYIERKTGGNVFGG